MKLTTSSKVKVHQNCLSRNVRGEEVILNLSSGMYYGLENVGVCVWEEVKKGTQVSSIIERVVDEFEVDQKSAEVDTLKLLDDLADKELISIGGLATLIGIE